MQFGVYGFTKDAVRGLERWQGFKNGLVFAFIVWGVWTQLPCSGEIELEFELEALLLQDDLPHCRYLLTVSRSEVKCVVSLGSCVYLSLSNSNWVLVCGVGSSV